MNPPVLKHMGLLIFIVNGQNRRTPAGVNASPIKCATNPKHTAAAIPMWPFRK
ncbi:hypothetical protein VV208B2_43740 (plasmid) [Vibrio vulnificus]|nr:hypothetical protein VV208B2_43740 [Vibrio vulnificus]BDP38462.1 hypothetical protein VA208B3_48330 [Vibrio alginolyticus]